MNFTTSGSYHAWCINICFVDSGKHRDGAKFTFGDKVPIFPWRTFAEVALWWRQRIKHNRYVWVKYYSWSVDTCLLIWKSLKTYSKIFNIRPTKSQNLNVRRLVLQLLCPIHWSQVSSWEYRWSGSSTDRQCSNYTRVINNFIAY